jgi:hypothetical protein
MVTTWTPKPSTRTVLTPAEATGRGPVRSLAAGVLAGVIAAGVGLAVLCAATVLLWATGPDSAGSDAATPVRTAASLWLFAQRNDLPTSAGVLRLTPLALTAGVIVLAVRAAGWAARWVRAHETGPACNVVIGFTVGFIGVTGGAAHATAHHPLAVGWLAATSHGLPFVVLAAVVGVAPQTWAFASLLGRTRPYGAAVLRGVGAASLVLIAGGAVVIAACSATHRAALAGSFAAAGGGWSGGIGLALLCFVYLPNAACWAVAVASGSGVAIATNARLDLGGADPSALPGLPLMHALPGAGALPAFAYLTLLIPFVAGMAAGWTVRPTADRRVLPTLGCAALAALLTAGLAGVAATASGGSLGGRLDRLGPSGTRVAAALAGELVVVAVLTAGLRILIRPRVVATPGLVLLKRRVHAEESHLALPGDLEDIEDTQEIPVLDQAVPKDTPPA